MIATIGLVGSSRFRYKRFDLRGKALDQAVSKWRAKWLAEVGETQETLNAVRQGMLLSEKAASEVRYQSGAKVFTPDE